MLTTDGRSNRNVDYGTSNNPDTDLYYSTENGSKEMNLADEAMTIVRNNKKKKILSINNHTSPRHMLLTAAAASQETDSYRQ